MTEATLAALADARPLESEDYFATTGDRFEANVQGENPDEIYKLTEAQFPTAPVEEDYQRILLVTSPGDKRQLTVRLEQENPDEEGTAHAEMRVDDPQVAESPEVVGKVLGAVMEKYYLQKVVTREEDVGSSPSTKHLDAARFLIQAGYEESETPGVFELRAAA